MLTAKHFLRLFLALYLAIAALLVITYFTTPFYGGLTRIGLLPESMFGWRMPQPVVPELPLLKSVTAANADVLVIGDSFSYHLLWQSKLVNKGIKVKTLHWTDFGSSLCDNVGTWLKNNGFNKQGIVIIESVQTLFEQRLDASLNCRKAKQPFADVERVVGRPLVNPLLGSGARNASEKLQTGIAQLWNAQLAKTASETRKFSSSSSGNATVVRATPRGCEWFSHAYCNKTLFLAEDDERDNLSAATLDKIKQINLALGEYNVVWLIIPDKTTIYFEKDHAFWEQLEAGSLGPNLYRSFLAERDVMRDFYFPNDTHLSSAGFLQLGNMTVDYLASTHRIRK